MTEAAEKNEYIDVKTQGLHYQSTVSHRGGPNALLYPAATGVCFSSHIDSPTSLSAVGLMPLIS